MMESRPPTRKHSWPWYLAGEGNGEDMGFLDQKE